MKRRDKQIRTSIIIVGFVMTVLVISCLYILNGINKHQAEKTDEFLTQMTLQYKTSIVRQVEGDLETLQGMATIIGAEDYIDKDELMEMLRNENENNRFMRMGFIELNGIASLVDIDGSLIEDADLSKMHYVKQVLTGKGVVSETLKDSFGDGYINVYAVPIYQHEELIGALCAVNASNVYRSIVDLPSLGNGFATIIKSNGDLVIRSERDPNSDYTSIFLLDFKDAVSKKTVQQELLEGKNGSFLYTQGGVEYRAFFTPLEINDWVVVSAIPNSLLTKDIQFVSKMAICAILVIIILLTALLRYIFTIIEKGRKSLEQLAYFDDLTGIYTKTKFMMEGERILLQSTDYTMVVFDITNFKMVNELFGYRSGDKFLKHIAQCMTHHLNDDELYYRDSADCFGMFLHEQDREVILERLEQLFLEIRTYHIHPLQHFYIHCDCGIKIMNAQDAMYPIEMIISRSMMALKKCKQEGISWYCIYDDQLYEKIQHYTQIEARMEKALKEEEFEVYLQPKYDLKCKQITGVEALVRWNMDGNIIYPDEFVPLFEENGFITELDMYILDKACTFMDEWMEKGYPVKQINVNQSRLLFYRSNYLDELDYILKRHKVSAASIVLEVTESVALKNMEVLVETLNALHNKGFQVSMDDFGSGYSSLNLLQTLHFDELKLDRVFIKYHHEDHEKQKAIIQKVVELSKELHMRTVAEGVETKEQLAFLEEIGCDIVQGFYFSKPVPKAEFDRILDEQQKINEKL